MLCIRNVLIYVPEFQSSQMHALIFAHALETIHDGMVRKRRKKKRTKENICVGM